MKKILLFVLLTASLSYCQSFTSVTITSLTDANAQVWQNAIVSFQLQQPFGNPAPMLNQGHPITDSPQSIFLNNAGSGSLTLDNNSAITPSGSRWAVTVCPNATVANCTVGTLFITGASLDITAALQSLMVIPTVFAGPSVYRAYGDGEVSGGIGGIYWRTTDNTLRGCATTVNGLCTSWQQIGGTGTLFYQTVQDNAVALTQRPIINLIPGTNISITCVDNNPSTRTDCTFNNTGSGTVSGSGTTNRLAVWTSSSSLGTSIVSDLGTGLTMGVSANNVSNTYGIQYIHGPSANCTSNTNTFPSINILQGCQGLQIQEVPTGTPTGTITAVMGVASSGVGTPATTIGVAGISQMSVTTTNSIGGYFSCNGAVAVSITNCRGLFAYANNGTFTGTTPLVENGFQTGIGSGNTTTNDDTIHVYGPNILGGTLTNHAGILIEDQTVTGAGFNSNPFAIRILGGKVSFASQGFNINTTQYATGFQGTTGTNVFICTGTFTSGDMVTSDANGNCIDSGAAAPTILRSFAVAGCTPATSTDSSCSGTITISPALSTSTYNAFIQTQDTAGAFLYTVITGSLATNSIPYTTTCTFNCGTINQPQLFVLVTK